MTFDPAFFGDWHTLLSSLASNRYHALTVSVPPPMPVLEYAAPETSRPRRRAISTLLVLSITLLVLVPILIASINIESIMITGPLLAGIGICLVVFGVVGRNRLPFWIGVSHVVICAIVFAWIRAFNIRPRGAYAPVLILSLIYLVPGIVAPLVWLVRRNDADELK